MGNRANIKVVDGQDSVWLYSHWDGDELPEILHVALSRRQRWDHAPYLTRIIFCQMAKGDEDGETGLGISSTIGDNEHLIIVVDVGMQTVSLEKEAGGVTFKPIPIEKFVDNPSKLFKSYRKRRD